MSMSKATGRSHMVVIYYCMTCASNPNRHVIALLYRYELAIVVVATSGGDNPAGGMMEIVPVRWRWRSKAQEKAIPYHNY